MTPLDAIYWAWELWAVSWFVAALWSRRTSARPPARGQVLHLAPTILGFGLLAFAARARETRWAASDGSTALWNAGEVGGWLLVGLVVAGFGFCWWARLHLGALWSGTIRVTEGHRVVDTGPYRLVRHPIYTGIIAAAFATAAEVASPVAFLGAALMSLGFWLKAGQEERFLSDQLGADAYADYRRRTPMLVPFTRWRGG